MHTKSGSGWRSGAGWMAVLSLLAFSFFCFNVLGQSENRRYAPQQRSSFLSLTQASFPTNNEPLGYGRDSNEDADEEADQEAREVEAQSNFDAIMLDNKAPERQKVPAQRMPAASDESPESPMPREPSADAVESEVKLPLEEYASLRNSLQTLHKEGELTPGPLVTLGATEYSGDAIPGALSLRMVMQVTLGHDGGWKQVPLVGDDVVLVNATVDGRPVPVSGRNGYHVWVTKDAGEATVLADILVPSRGPRGSIEYDFLVARTPVTRFQCYFPVEGLEPRLNTAVQSESRPEREGTLFSAVLRPTPRIHLVGFKDLGEAEGQKAKVYAESLNLLSVDEGALEVFAVLRYTILYAATKEFNILIPDGMKVVSADGMGAFSFTLEPVEGGTLLKGETAFPIRNNYEISLRLRREMKKGGDNFLVPLPRCRDVERESGWLGVEVPGKLKLEETRREEARAVDVRQLPEEMVRSSVSPILKAYRYDAEEARIELAAARLPEIEPTSGSIDQIRAFTKVTREGNVVTELKIRLRNRLRHSLSLKLPAETRVSSALLDGQPFNPSEDAEGKILLPLKRSSGSEGLEPFMISVVLESHREPFGWYGLSELSLPAVDLPISNLAWKIYLPARNIYSRPESDIESQRYVGRAEWSQPVYSGETFAGDDEEQLSGFSSVQPTSSADSGAMPVRIEIPKEGTMLSYERYWIEADQPVTVFFRYLRGWLRIPAWMTMAGVLALGLLLISGRVRRAVVGKPIPWGDPGIWGGIVLGFLGSVGAFYFGGADAVTLGLLLGVLAVSVHRDWFQRGARGVGQWASTLGERFRNREKGTRPWTVRRAFWSMVVTGFVSVLGLVLFERTLEVLWLLFRPMGG